jgi:hypothetical protein
MKKPRLHELAHRMETDVDLCVGREHRAAFLRYVASGFDETGKRIEHSPGQTNVLICMDCERSSDECERCNETQRTEKEGR